MKKYKLILYLHGFEKSAFPLLNNIYYLLVDNDIDILFWIDNVLYTDKTDISYDIEFISSNKKIFYLLKNILCIPKLLNQCKDQQYILYYSSGLFLLIHMLFSKLYNKKIIFIPTYVPSNIIFFNKIYFKLCSFFVDSFLFNNSNFYNFNNKKAYICNRHYVDTSKFFIKKAYNSRNNNIGYVGRLSKEKGILKLLEIIDILYKKYPIFSKNIYFYIIGDGPLRNDVSNFINNNTNYSNIILLPWINHDDLLNIYNELKLLLIPSFSETGPQVALESMACGTPIMANNVGIIDQLIDENVGYIIYNNDSSIFADNIYKSITEYNLISMSISCSAKIYNYYNYSAVKNHFLNIFYRILGDID
jgi:glycosyltransferase involved in cell wall biosynthesis